MGKKLILLSGLFFFSITLGNDGDLDSTFSDDGIVLTPIGYEDDQGMAVTVQSDGKIVVAGYAHTGSNNDFAVVRYNTDGSLDNNFGGNGIVLRSTGSGNCEYNEIWNSLCTGVHTYSGNGISTYQGGNSNLTNNIIFNSSGNSGQYSGNGILAFQFTNTKIINNKTDKNAINLDSLFFRFKFIHPNIIFIVKQGMVLQFSLFK